MQKIAVKVVQDDKDLPLPKYQTEGSAGMDVYSAASLVLKPGEVKLVPTGLRLAIPQGYEIHVRARSGLALKHGVTVLNGIGTVDSDYRGPLGVILINHGNADFAIQKGDRIAQLVLNKCEQIAWDVTDSLDETERGEGGFGSTGVSKEQKTLFSSTIKG